MKQLYRLSFITLKDLFRKEKFEVADKKLSNDDETVAQQYSLFNDKKLALNRASHSANLEEHFFALFLENMRIVGNLARE